MLQLSCRLDVSYHKELNIVPEMNNKYIFSPYINFLVSWNFSFVLLAVNVPLGNGKKPVLEPNHQIAICVFGLLQGDKLRVMYFSLQKIGGLPSARLPTLGRSTLKLIYKKKPFLCIYFRIFYLTDSYAGWMNHDILGTCIR